MLDVNDIVLVNVIVVTILARREFVTCLPTLRFPCGDAADVEDSERISHRAAGLLQADRDQPLVGGALVAIERGSPHAAGLLQADLGQPLVGGALEEDERCSEPLAESILVDVATSRKNERALLVKLGRRNATLSISYCCRRPILVVNVSCAAAETRRSL